MSSFLEYLSSRFLSSKKEDIAFLRIKELAIKGWIFLDEVTKYQAKPELTKLLTEVNDDVDLMLQISSFLSRNELNEALEWARKQGFLTDIYWCLSDVLVLYRLSSTVSNGIVKYKKLLDELTIAQSPFKWINPPPVILEKIFQNESNFEYRYLAAEPFVLDLFSKEINPSIGNQLIKFSSYNSKINTLFEHGKVATFTNFHNTCSVTVSLIQKSDHEILNVKDFIGYLIIEHISKEKEYKKICGSAEISLIRSDIEWFTFVPMNFN